MPEMPRRLPRSVVTSAGLTVAVLLLANCTAMATSVINYVHFSRYSRSDLVYAANGRDMKVEVKGELLPQSGGGTTGTIVTSAMQGEIPSITTNFTTSPGESARTDWRIVWAFTEGRGPAGDSLCRAGDALDNSPGVRDSYRTSAAFCYGDEALSWLQGRLPAPAANRMGFVNGIKQMTRQLLPRENPHYPNYNCRLGMTFDC